MLIIVEKLIKKEKSSYDFNQTYKQEPNLSIE